MGKVPAQLDLRPSAFVVLDSHHLPCLSLDCARFRGSALLLAPTWSTCVLFSYSTMVGLNSHEEAWLDNINIVVHVHRDAN